MTKGVWSLLGFRGFERCSKNQLFYHTHPTKIAVWFFMEGSLADGGLGVRFQGLGFRVFRLVVPLGMLTCLKGERCAVTFLFLR